jgi:hypothetical protein
LIYLFNPGKALKNVVKTVTKPVKNIADSVIDAVLPDIPSPGSPEVRDAGPQETNEEAEKESSRRVAAERGGGFQDTVLTGFAGGADEANLRKKTLLGS